jgi:hypothetical protein
MKRKFWSIWLYTCLSWRTFCLWRHWYPFFARVLILICIFARRADMGNCDVANITPCKFCIITTKFMIKYNTLIKYNVKAKKVALDFSFLTLNTLFGSESVWRVKIQHLPPCITSHMGVQKCEDRGCWCWSVDFNESWHN